MNRCASTDIRDALPDLIHGRLDAARVAEVESHLASCDACRAELELLRAVMASAPDVPPMSVDRIIAALPTPTRHGFLLHDGGGKSDTQPIGNRSRTFWSRPLVRIAAAAAIVIAGGLSLLVGREVLNPETQVGQSPTRVATVDTPIVPVVAQGGSVETTATPRTRPAQVAEVTTGGLSLVSETQDLSDEHLATLLSEMDRMDGLPSTEPDVVAPVIGDSESRGGSQ